MRRPFMSPLPERRTPTKPPPDVPSISAVSSSACTESILDLSSAACFIIPRKSGIALSYRDSHLEIAILIVAPPIRTVSRAVVDGWWFRHCLVGLAARELRQLLGLAHADDFGAGKAL